jgi:hypothetical protein
MSLNLLNTTAARMAYFLAGSWAVLAGEPEKRAERELFFLAPQEREILAFTALGMIAEAHDGYVNDEDIVAAAWTFATCPEEVVPLATDLWQVLRDCQ